MELQEIQPAEGSARPSTPIITLLNPNTTSFESSPASIYNDVIFPKDATARSQEIYRLAIEKLQTLQDGDKSLKVTAEQWETMKAYKTAEDVFKEYDDAQQERKLPDSVSSRLRAYAKKGSRGLVRGVRRYEPVVDAVSQAGGDVSMLLWGGLKLILVIANDVFDVFERVIEIRNRVVSFLQLFGEYLKIKNLSIKGLLLQCLVDFHATVIGFCLRAANIYREKRLAILRRAIWSSVNAPFDKLLTDLVSTSGFVEKAIRMENTKAIQGTRADIKALKTVKPKEDVVHCPVFSMPNYATTHFVGRQTILDQLKLCYSQSGTPFIPKKAVLWGMSGVGKTQIALKFALDNFDNYNYVFFLRAANEKVLMEDIALAADRLKLFSDEEKEDGEDKNEEVLLSRCKAWASRLTTWLLVFDDAFELAQVRRVLPQGDGHILFTTRNTIAARALVEGAKNIIEVQPFSAAESTQLIQTLLDVPDADISGSTEVHQLFEGLPIAIDQAVTRAQMEKWSLLQLTENIQKEKIKILSIKTPTMLHETNVGVAVLFLSRFRELAITRPQAMALLKVMVYLDTSHIPLGITLFGGQRMMRDLESRLPHAKEILKSEPLDIVGQPLIGKQNAATARKSVPATSNAYSGRFFGIRKLLHRKSVATEQKPPLWESVRSAHDLELEKYLLTDPYLVHVLSSLMYFESAIIDLKAAGLIRQVNDQVVSIHHLIRDLLIESMRLDSRPMVFPMCALNIIHMAEIFSHEYFQWLEQSGYLYQRAKDLSRPERHEFVAHAFSVCQHCKEIAPNTRAGPHLLEMIGWYEDSLEGLLIVAAKLLKLMSPQQIWDNVRERGLLFSIIWSISRVAATLGEREREPTEKLKWLSLAQDGYNLIGNRGEVADQLYEVCDQIGDTRAAVYWGWERAIFRRQEWLQIGTNAATLSALYEKAEDWKQAQLFAREELRVHESWAYPMQMPRTETFLRFASFTPLPSDDGNFDTLHEETAEADVVTSRGSLEDLLQHDQANFTKHPDGFPKKENNPRLPDVARRYRGE